MARIVDELQNIADKLANLNITVNMTAPDPLNIKVVDYDGIPIGLKHVNNKLRISSMPYIYDIAEGNVPNHFSHSSFGRAFNVNLTEVELWEVGGVYKFPAAPMQMQVVSSSAADGPAGAGARQVKIYYLDANYIELTELVNLNGTTPVNTSATNILRINDLHVTDAGNNKCSAGNIDIRNLAGTEIYSRISATRNASLQAIWTVPDGYTLYLTSWKCSAFQAKEKVSFIVLRTTSDHEGNLTAGIFMHKDIVSLYNNHAVVPFTAPVKIPSRADVKLTGYADKLDSVATISGGFEGWYEI